MASKKYAEIGKDCVACGSCVRTCPMKAISVWKGVTAVVDIMRCVGCGRCSLVCPAGVITMGKREDVI